MSLSDTIIDIQILPKPALRTDMVEVGNLKDSIRKIKDRIIENDIYTADEIFRIINEEMGDKLI